VNGKANEAKIITCGDIGSNGEISHGSSLVASASVLSDKLNINNGRTAGILTINNREINNRNEIATSINIYFRVRHLLVVRW
jgi:hypothetical protein